MKKPSVILGKKHIILACLTLMLGIAIYLNYVFTQSGKDLKITDVVSPMTGQQSARLDPVDEGKAVSAASGDSAAENTEHYGDAEFVNTTTSGESVSAGVSKTDDYFAQARMDKKTKREEVVSTLQTMLGGGDLTEEEVASMQVDAVQISKLVEAESVVENLIKAQGFEDCVVYLDGASANIVVKSEGLQPEQAAQIKNILLGQVAVAQENITIFEVK